jgi:hypothetical protein
MERRQGTKKNTGEPPARLTLSREIVKEGPDCVQQAARGNEVVADRSFAVTHPR